MLNLKTNVQRDYANQLEDVSIQVALNGRYRPLNLAMHFTRRFVKVASLYVHEDLERRVLGDHDSLDHSREFRGVLGS